MIVAIITATKAEEIQDKEWTPGVKYNPVQMEDGRWFVSTAEIQNWDLSDIVSLFNYEPKTDENEI